MSGLDITCVTLVELVKYLERGLPDREQLSFELHLTVCPECLHHVDKVRRTARAVGSLEGESIDPQRRAALIEAFAARRPAPR
jgi:anti-sigma factor RsiW